MLRSLRWLLVSAVLLLLADATPVIEQKRPTRNSNSVGRATSASLSGYQGPSTTKGKEKELRKPIVEQKKPKRSPNAVSTATRAGLEGYSGPSSTKK